MDNPEKLATQDTRQKTNKAKTTTQYAAHNYP